MCGVGRRRRAGALATPMEMIVLIIHLLVCICLIGLVLLQRSEGGALGMGGGGGGSLMSGRGAADALAKMTSVAGGFFLVTSLSLTVLSGAASNSGGNSVFDLIQGGQPAVTTPAPEAPVVEPETTPDPTESSLPQTGGDTQLAALGPAPAAATPPVGGATRAGPLDTRSPPPAVTQPASATGTQRPAAPPPAAVTRTPPATTPPAPVIPNTSGGVGGITLEDDGQTPTESIEIGDGGLGAVRRERAGPDQ